MDNKITKKRIGEMFSYELVLLCIILVIVIFLWSMLLSLTGVKLSRGQKFVYFFDYTICESNPDELKSLLSDQNVFGYNVLELENESIIKGSSNLTTKLSANIGDIIFTSKTEEDNKSVLANTIVDAKYGYALIDLLRDAENYLNSFKVDGEFDDGLIKTHFLDRMKKDNRFRTNAQKEQGILLEKQNLIRLSKEVEDFKVVLSHDEIMFKTTKYKQVLSLVTDEYYKENYGVLYQREIDNGRENIAYGIDLSKLIAGEDKIDVTRFVSFESTASVSGVVMMPLNFLEHQQDEQFEVIAFMNCIVRNCSNILEG